MGRLNIFFSVGSTAIRGGAFVIASIIAASAATAADLPSRAEPPIMPPLPPAPYNWTGFYVGVNGGVGLDHFAFPYKFTLPGTVEGTSGITSRGAVLGGQIGYNYELTNLPIIGHAVVGVEVDSDWSAVAGTNTAGTLAGTATFGTRFEDFGTARLRVGYNFDRLLVYLTGGLTYGTTETYYSIAGLSGATTATYTGVFPRVGVVGIGAEYALTNNFSIKAEYVYDFVGARWDSFSTPPSQVDFGTRSMYHIARIGLNYKLDLFSPPVPIVAKY
jgi:outer membrane immunogenic protein